tara:strand:+ start:3356 stop:4273 length:918 start_codon:yes stop_codon:yes gene_type:complete
MKSLIIGTRGSKLALYQTNLVLNKIKKILPNVRILTKVIKTKGDLLLDKDLTKVLDKGFFTSEIQEALYDEEIDLAVHSLKDLPTIISDKSYIVAILKRDDHRDVFISNHKTPLNFFDRYKKIGTSSLRRKSQLLAINNDLNIFPIRGNVDTRIKKMINGDYDGLVVAAAGVKRLGLEKYITEYFDANKILTAPGQGAIAVEIRNSDSDLKNVLVELNDNDTNLCVSAERSFLNTLSGGCHVPFAAYSTINEKTITIDALVGSIDGKKIIRDTISGPEEKYIELGIEIAERILKNGGKEIIDSLR